ncbi:MAG: hypothetical protein NT091_02345 [Candidatus Falkowbacteria bacterium]|nr:hypothetical protein [Candidatus Falkowbacteria bacterium]
MFNRNVKKNRFVNPYYRQKENNLKVINISNRIKLIIFELLLIFSSLVWFFCFSQVYNIDTIKVVGNKRIPKEEIAKIIRLQFSNIKLFFGSEENVFLFDVDKAKQAINDRYYLTSLAITKRGRGGIEVVLAEKDYSAIWREDNKYYYIDEIGKVVDKADPLQIKKVYPLIDNIDKNKFKLNTIVGEDTTIAYVLGVFKKIRYEQTDLLTDLNRFVIDSSSTLKVVFNKRPYLLFDLTGDLEKQVAKLIVIKNDRLKDEYDKKEYIDLRYGDRVYYR